MCHLIHIFLLPESKTTGSGCGNVIGLRWTTEVFATSPESYENGMAATNSSELSNYQTLPE